MRKRINKEEHPEPEPLTGDKIRTLYQRAFEILNRDLFNGELQPILIDFYNNFIATVQDAEATEDTEEDTEAFFYYDPEHIEESMIILNASIYDRSPIDGISEDDINNLFHEMTHYYCYQKNIKDHTANTQFHNAIFKQVVESHGEKCHYVNSQYGYMDTELARDYLFKVLDEI